MAIRTNEIGNSIKDLLEESGMVWDSCSNEILIETVDGTDSNNLIVLLETGQKFYVRIFTK